MAEMNVPPGDQPGGQEEGSRGYQSLSLHASKDTPAPYCRCPRQGDFWLCAGRPELTTDPDGNRCALGATVAAAGNDHDPREELERALEEADRRG